METLCRITMQPRDYYAASQSDRSGEEAKLFSVLIQIVDPLFELKLKTISLLHRCDHFVSTRKFLN